MNEFTTLRPQAGLTVEEAAELIGYTERTVFRWEAGDTRPRKAILDSLRAARPGAKQESQGSAFTFIDLFAGIGGLRRGFETIGGKCVYTCEWDRYSQMTYRANFPGDAHQIADDIREVKAESIRDHEVLLAGFPCQPFSIAGVSKKNALSRPHGFACEAQGTLFFEVARIIRHHQPKAFLLENVKNLINHDGGETFRVIHNVLTKELGYRIQWRVIDAKSFVPQHRERIFIAGFREACAFSFDDLQIRDPLSGPTLNSILHPGNGTEKPEGHFTTGSMAKVAPRYTLTDRLWTYLKNYADKHRDAKSLAITTP